LVWFFELLDKADEKRIMRKIEADFEEAKREMEKENSSSEK